ncbi:hypothetical protein [Bacteroides sp. 51]|uniref:hypothetical protein n=1 Tax=Bacteroides sp. 51 TaxID=2302938 RepID=UPI0013D024C7|nr:hypothetical protein [Bacteroides sp. 51]NDV80565.1 hypothetical protein [Bacteroides sp. 51]
MCKIRFIILSISFIFCIPNIFYGQKVEDVILPKLVENKLMNLDSIIDSLILGSKCVKEKGINKFGITCIYDTDVYLRLVITAKEEIIESDRFGNGAGFFEVNNSLFIVNNNPNDLFKKGSDRKVIKFIEYEPMPDDPPTWFLYFKNHNYFSYREICQW